MYAVIKLGSSQYKVAEGDTIESDRLTGKAGDTITLDNVILVANGSDVKVGQPYIKNAKVTAKVIGDTLGEKTITFKFRRRKDSKTTRGGRAKLTKLNITKIAA